MTDDDGVLAPLGKWSSTLFLISGAVVAVYSSLYGMEAFAGTYPAARDFIGPGGYIIGFLGLLGLHPKFADRNPKLAHAGAVFAVLGIVGFLLTMADSAGVVPEEPPAWFAMSELLSILVGWVLAFLLFSVASLRSDAYSRTLGLLLLTPIAVMVLNLAVVAAGLASPEARLVNSGLWALSFLAIGFTLRSQDGQTARAGRAPDSAA